MAVNLRGVTVVLLPGTGSDDDYVYRAFSAALHDVGATVVTPAPRARPARRRATVDALDDAARHGPDRGRRGVDRRRGRRRRGRWRTRRMPSPCWRRFPRGPAHPTARRPRWPPGTRRTCCGATGWPRRSPQMRASSPAWLADELTRSWVGQWPALPDAMDEAAGYVAPTCEELETWPCRWASPRPPTIRCIPSRWPSSGSAAAPRAALRTVTLDAMGADPGGSGRGVRGRAAGGLTGEPTRSNRP